MGEGLSGDLILTENEKQSRRERVYGKEYRKCKDTEMRDSLNSYRNREKFSISEL